MSKSANRWNARSDRDKALRLLAAATLCGLTVVFLPYLIPPDDFINKSAQTVLMLLALLCAFGSGLHASKLPEGRIRRDGDPQDGDRV